MFSMMFVGSNSVELSNEKKFEKASELLWGSINKLAIAIASLYGKKVGKHKQLVLLMRDLALGDPEIIDGINSAEALHSNFYHNWMEEEAFVDNVKKVIDLRLWLIKKLDDKLKGTSKTYTLENSDSY